MGEIGAHMGMLGGDLAGFGTNVSRIAVAALAATVLAAGARAQPVQSPANGHWYEVVARPQGLCWTAGFADARARGGYLVTITSAAEQDFVLARLIADNPPTGPVLIGLDRLPTGTYGWITGESVAYTDWYPGEPNNSGGVENRGTILWTQSAANNGRSGLWNDLANCGNPDVPGDYGVPASFIVEYPCPPEMWMQPSPARACPTGVALFSVAAAGMGPFTYQWQLEASPGQWTTLGSTPASLPGGGTAFVTPASGPDVNIGVRDRSGPFSVRCIITGGTGCGSVTSEPTTLTISCPNKADVASLGGAGACDGQNTTDDIVYYLAQFFANNTAVADLVSLGGAGGPDGLITADDLVAFLAAFFAGCP